jgi:uncharacterized protein (TIGR03382 family)
MIRLATPVSSSSVTIVMLAAGAGALLAVFRRRKGEAARRKRQGRHWVIRAAAVSLSALGASSCQMLAQAT